MKLFYKNENLKHPQRIKVIGKITPIKAVFMFSLAPTIVFAKSFANSNSY